jgi:hypothetical protein
MAFLSIFHFRCRFVEPKTPEGDRFQGSLRNKEQVRLFSDSCKILLNFNVESRNFPSSTYANTPAYSNVPLNLVHVKKIFLKRSDFFHAEEDQ